MWKSDLFRATFPLYSSSFCISSLSLLFSRVKHNHVYLSSLCHMNCCPLLLLVASLIEGKFYGKQKGRRMRQWFFFPFCFFLCSPFSPLPCPVLVFSLPCCSSLSPLPCPALVLSSPPSPLTGLTVLALCSLQARCKGVQNSEGDECTDRSCMRQNAALHRKRESYTTHGVVPHRD